MEDSNGTAQAPKASILKNLSILKPAHFFSFGFVMLAALVIIFYGIFFGFSESGSSIDSSVDPIPARTFEPGLSANQEHAELMDEHYEEQRKKAEASQGTAVPPIPTTVGDTGTSSEEWEDNPYDKDNDNYIVDDVPKPEDATPPTLDLSKMNKSMTWEPPPTDQSSLPSNTQSSPGESQVSGERVTKKLTAISALVKKFHKQQNDAHTEQKGAYWSASETGQKGNDNESQTASNQPAAIPATSRFVCKTTHAINNKISTIPFVEAECYTGIMKGGKIQGNFKAGKESLNLEFTSFHKNGRTVAIKGYAIDPKTKVIGLATDVDKHTLERHLALFSSSFLEGIGALLGSTKVIVSGETVAAETDYDTNDRIIQGVNKIGSRYAPKAEEYFETEATISVRKNQTFTLMIIEDVPAEGFPLTVADR